MKKLLLITMSLILAISLAITASAYHIASNTKTAEQALSEYAASAGSAVETYRYYFLMPDGSHGHKDQDGKVPASWYSSYTAGAGVYWWDGPAAPSEYTGYRAKVEKGDEHIFYVDMPREVESFIWNNGVDGGSDKSSAVYSKSYCTAEIDCTYAVAGEYSTLPDGCENFDECIYIIDPNLIAPSSYAANTCIGSWYHYYGKGCYGSGTGSSARCLNPDHYKDGKHVGANAADDQYIVGDADLDGAVTIMDATRIQRVIAQLLTMNSETEKRASDADRDGSVTIMDATRIQNYLARITDMDGNRLTPEVKPTEAPTEAPTEEPTEAPTEAPTQEPTQEPTTAPSEPTIAPTIAAPTAAPTAEPTVRQDSEPTTVAPTTTSTTAPTTAQ